MSCGIRARSLDASRMLVPWTTAGFSPRFVLLQLPFSWDLANLLFLRARNFISRLRGLPGGGRRWPGRTGTGLSPAARTWRSCFGEGAAAPTQPKRAE